MVFKKKKISARRQQVRKDISTERMVKLSQIANSSLPVTTAVWLVFIISVIIILSVDSSSGQLWKPDSDIFLPFKNVSALTAIVILVSLGAALYVHHYQPRIMHRPTRTLSSLPTNH